MTRLVIGLVWPYANWGGAQTHLATLVAPLSHRHQVVAFVPRPASPTLCALLDEAGVTVVQTGPPTRSAATSSLRSRVDRRVADLRAYSEALRAIRSHHPAPDVFHVDIPLWNGTAAVHALLNRAPVVQTFHTPLSPPRRTLRDLLLRAKFRSVVRRRSYRLQATSEASATSLRPWVGARPKVDVIATVDLRAVDTVAQVSVEAIRTDLGVPPERIVIGTLGQLIERKGLDLLIAAGRRLVDDGLDLHILLGGDGDAASDLRRSGDGLDLSDRLTIVASADLGATHADQLRVLAALDVLVMPSRDEGLPLTLLEALAMSRTAIVTDVGAIGDVFVDDEHLLLVPRDDVDALVAAIHRVVADVGLRARLGSAGRQRVRELYDPGRAANRNEDVMLQLVGSVGSHPVHD
jgi:glycosyltransferase involved in cell wall biosynthesis